jgi:hypothetical protein
MDEGVALDLWNTNEVVGDERTEKGSRLEPKRDGGVTLYRRNRDRTAAVLWISNEKSWGSLTAVLRENGGE